MLTHILNLLWLYLILLKAEQQCDDDVSSTGEDCSNEFIELCPGCTASELLDYLYSFASAQKWMDVWNAMTVDDLKEKDAYCSSIHAIKDIPTDSCLCGLQLHCHLLCSDIENQAAITYLGVYITDNTDMSQFTASKCEDAQKYIDEHTDYCTDQTKYNKIKNCANNHDNSSPPTISPTTLTPSTISTQFVSTSNMTSSPTLVPTVMPTTSVPTTPTRKKDNKHATPSPSGSPTLEPTVPSLEPTSYPIAQNITFPYANSTTIINDNFEKFPTASPSDQAEVIAQTDQSSTFTNLLLVALIILAFCVFVAWYARKNQITDPNQDKADSENYLWGLTGSSPSSNDTMKVKTKNGKSFASFGNYTDSDTDPSDDDDHHDNHHNKGIEMMDRNRNRNHRTHLNERDLIPIPPEPVSRGMMMTSAPNGVAPSVPISNKRKSKKKRKNKTKRKGKGSKFVQLADDDEANDDDDDNDNSNSDGSTRDALNATKEKLSRFASDIQDDIKTRSHALQQKFIKPQATVVVPMNGKKKQPFTFVEPETSDGFDYHDQSSGDEKNNEKLKEKSKTSQNDDFSGDNSETSVKENFFGRKIKQPMKLPTFDQFDDDDDEDAAIIMDIKSSKESKKKKKKRKKHKKNRRSQNNGDVEIDVKVNNDIGFGDDELELNQEDVTLTVKELEAELMNKHSTPPVENEKDIGVDIFINNFGQSTNANGHANPTN